MINNMNRCIKERLKLEDFAMQIKIVDTHNTPLTQKRKQIYTYLINSLHTQIMSIIKTEWVKNELTIKQNKTDKDTESTLLICDAYADAVRAFEYTLGIFTLTCVAPSRQKEFEVKCQDEEGNYNILGILKAFKADDLIMKDEDLSVNITNSIFEMVSKMLYAKVRHEYEEWQEPFLKDLIKLIKDYRNAENKQFLKEKYE